MFPISHLQIYSLVQYFHFRTNYYSDVNPRNMRRLMHIVAVTGKTREDFKILKSTP